jgi:hypothetical protein
VLWVTGHRSKVSQNRPMQKLPQHETVPKTNTEIGPTMGASTPPLIPTYNFGSGFWEQVKGCKRSLLISAGTRRISPGSRGYGQFTMSSLSGSWYSAVHKQKSPKPLDLGLSQ